MAPQQQTKYDDFFNVTELDAPPLSDGDEEFSIAISGKDLARVTISSVATAAFIFLTVLAFSDMKSRQQRSPQLRSSDFFFVLRSVLVIICICEIIEFFIIYDYMFYQSIHWARHNQWLAFYIEYTRMLQTTVILATGVHQSLTIVNCCDFGPAGSILMAANFMGMSLFLPTVALLVTLHDGSMSLTYFFHPSLVVLIPALLVGAALYAVAKRWLLKMNECDVLATKAVLLFQSLIITQALEAFAADWLCYLLGTGEWYIVNSIEDLFRPMYPATYLIMYRYKAWSARVFSCLNSVDGAHRLSLHGEDESSGHEMTESTGVIPLSFPTGVFSISGEDDESACLVQNPGLINPMPSLPPPQQHSHLSSIYEENCNSPAR